ncbi:MAG: Lar family restriction alleviation protein [Lachnospiraceae bacterium]|nr:Lar family restriction alleviation protein [Lachnospiraceae bacterium]
MAKTTDKDNAEKFIKEYLDGMKKLPEMKNCPFCGGHASFSTKNQPSGVLIYAKCECDDCHAVIGVNQADAMDLLKELCIAKWNRRTVEGKSGV